MRVAPNKDHRFRHMISYAYGAHVPSHSCSTHAHMLITHSCRFDQPTIFPSPNLPHDINPANPLRNWMFLSWHGLT